MLGLGMVIGAAIGAGIALLMAPASGEDTRDRIRHGVRTIRGADGAWEKLGRELRRANAVRRKRHVAQQNREEQKALEKERAERDAQVTPV